MPCCRPSPPPTDLASSLWVLRPADQDLAALTASGAIGPRPVSSLDGTARLAFLVSGDWGEDHLLSAVLGAVPAGSGSYVWDARNRAASASGA